jgi:hypothetical protein
MALIGHVGTVAAAEAFAGEARAVFWRREWHVPRIVEGRHAEEREQLSGAKETAG